MTALDHDTPIPAKSLAEIQERNDRALKAAENPACSLDQAEFDRAMLCAEVERLQVALADLLGQNAMTESNFDDYAEDAIREQKRLTGQVEAAKVVVSRLTSERDQAVAAAQHLAGAMAKVGPALLEALRLAVAGDAVGAAAVLGDVAPEGPEGGETGD